MIAINVSPTSETTYSLDDLFPTNATTVVGGTAAAADEIRLWNGEGYRYFFRFYKTKGTSGGIDNKLKCGHWVEDLSDGSYPMNTGVVKAGDAIFYVNKSEKDTQVLTIPGQVPHEAVNTLQGGYNLVGVGFPAQWNPNDCGTNFWMNTAYTAGGTAAASDQIYSWDKTSQTYRKFFLFYKTKGTSGGVSNKDKCYKWVEDIDPDFPVLEEKFDVGDGFFYIKQKPGEVEFKPGLKL